MAVLPVDIPPADEACAHTVSSYGGVANADATTPAVYQTSVDVDASAQSPKHSRRTGALAAGASLAAMALMVAGVVTGSHTNAASSIIGTGNALVEEAASHASAAKIAASQTTVSHTSASQPSESTDVASTEAPVDYAGKHVLFILVDDMGYNDMGYQSTDTPYTTETLNHYASKGVKLNNYYTQASCTPARVAILTGRYPMSVGMAYDGEGTFVVDSPYGIPLEFDLIGRHFSKGGYRTAFVGKWNVGHVEENYLPHRRGFDSSIMYNSDAIHYYNHTASPSLYVSGGDYAGDKAGVYDMLSGEANKPFQLDIDDIGTYTSSMFTDRAMEEFAKTKTDERSLFLYLAFQSVHVPHNMPPADLFDSSDTWKLQDVIRHDRYHFGRTAIAMDRSIARLMNHIENLGLSNDVIMAVASDNGACPTDGGNNWPMRGGKFQSWEGGVRVPSFIWSGAMESAVAGTQTDTLFHGVDWLPTLAKATGVLSDDDLTALDMDGIEMGDEILHGKYQVDNDSRSRMEVLLRMNKWKLSNDDTLDVLDFDDSYMTLIRVEDDHKWKIITNEYRGDRYEPTDSSYNVSCFETIGNPDDFLFDLNKDPYEETNLRIVRPDIFLDLKASLRTFYDAARTPAWSPPEEDLAYSAWDTTVGGDGFVTPWHRPQADVYQGKDDDGDSSQLATGASGAAVHPMT